MASLKDYLEWQSPKSALLSVPASCRFFEGHFPGLPILPGAVILEISRLFLFQAASATGSAFHVHKAKFSGFVRPEVSFQLTALPSANGNWDVRWTESTTKEEMVTLSVSFGS